MKKGFLGASVPPLLLPPGPATLSDFLSPTSSTRSGKPYNTKSKANRYRPMTAHDLASSSTVAASPYNFPLPPELIAMIAPHQELLPSTLQCDSAAGINKLPLVDSFAADSCNVLEPLLLDVVSSNDKAPGNLNEKNLGKQFGNLPTPDMVNSDAQNVPPPTSWKSLFKSKPCNAGKYVPRKFNIDLNSAASAPPPEVIDAGKTYWKNYLVGFFLDSGLSYLVVKRHLLKVWKLKGTVNVKCDKSLYYFDFSSLEERSRILEAPPVIIFGKVFIITQWSPSVDFAREQILSIPVWARFTSIPSVCQPLIGLNWLVNHIGDLICFDVSTERRDRLEFAKALIEITPDRPLPESLPVRLAEGKIAYVEVSYLWKPEICISCHSFGHLCETCPHSSLPSERLPPKVPLPRPPIRKWVPKNQADPALFTRPTDVSVPSTILMSEDNGKLSHLQSFLATAPLVQTTTLPLTPLDHTPSLPLSPQVLPPTMPHASSLPPPPPPPPPLPIVACASLTLPPPSPPLPPPSPPTPPPPPPVALLDNLMTGAMIPFPSADLDEGTEYSIDEIVPSHLFDPPGEIHVYGGDIDLSVDLPNLFSE